MSALRARCERLLAGAPPPAPWGPFLWTRKERDERNAPPMPRISSAPRLWDPCCPTRLLSRGTVAHVLWAALRAFSQSMAVLRHDIRGLNVKTIKHNCKVNYVLKNWADNTEIDRRSRQMKLISNFKILLIFFLCNHGPLSADNNRLSSIQEISGSEPGWKYLLVEPAKFSFAVPSPTRLSDHRMMSGSSEYIRIMNYAPRMSPYPGRGEFWLEIHIIDRKNKHGSWKSCAELIVHGIIMNQNGVKVYLGYPSERSPDVDASMKAQCVELGMIDVYMQGAEGTSNAPLLSKIFSTLRVLSHRAH